MSSSLTEYVFVTFLFFIVATIYSSVGHAGASGYSAVMALFSISPIFMRPTALILNLVVGSIGLYRFHKAGLINLKTVTPFLVTSVPATFWASQLKLNKEVFYVLLGGILLATGLKLVFGNENKIQLEETKAVPFVWSLPTGAVIGFFSGITGTGGAIFFTPLLLRMNWANPKSASGASVVFVLVNSIFGLAGIYQTTNIFEFRIMIIWLLAVIIGAIFGTYLGIFKYTNTGIQKILGLIMIIAALKLILMSV